MIRTLIVDDEPLAREGLRLWLAEESDIVLLPDARNGREALAAIAAQAPDLVFLDIQMPRLSGLDVVQAVPAAQRPLFIFLTAHSEHAVRAFRLEALDYLLKPVELAHLSAALARARAAVGRRRSALPNRSAEPSRLAFRADGRVHLIAPADIGHVEAAGDYVLLHTGGAPLLVRDTLAALSARLATHGFVRAHRSALVNLHQVRELDLRETDEPHLVLHGGVRIRVARSQREAVERALRLR